MYVGKAPVLRVKLNVIMHYAHRLGAQQMNKRRQPSFIIKYSVNLH
jgi:hypothetical protein